MYGETERRGGEGRHMPSRRERATASRSRIRAHTRIDIGHAWRDAWLDTPVKRTRIFPPSPSSRIPIAPFADPIFGPRFGQQSHAIISLQIRARVLMFVMYDTNNLFGQEKNINDSLADLIAARLTIW